MTVRQRIAGASPAMKFVVTVGIMSFFADFTYEGSRSITGPYLGLLGAGAFAISVISGAGEFLGYGLRLFSGRGADRTGRYWPITIGGYVLQMSVVPLLALAGNWQVAALLIILERVGKATRNPPRDAMLSHAAKEIGYGRAFGIHEALDQFGAMFGPLLVALVLAVTRHDYKIAFASLAVPAVIMLSLLAVARVLYPRPQDLAAGPAEVTTAGLPRVFWLYLAAAALAGAGFADFPLISYHFAQAGTVSAPLIPVFYAAAMAVSGTGSLVLGRIFDRAGIGVLIPLTVVAAAYAPLVFLGGFWASLVGASLWGLGMGVQESIIPAAVAPMVSPDRRASSAERAELQVAAVEVEVPAEILRLGFELVDTPGVGSAIEINTATTRRFLPQADAVIFVTGFDSPLTGAEVRFLADAARYAGKLFLVLNKRDLVSGRDAITVAEFVRHRLREDLGLGEPRLFGLSALEALKATVRGDSERLEGSGLAPLHAALTSFLATGKTRLFLHNVAQRGAALVAGQRRNLQLGRLTLDGGPHPSQVLTAFGVRMAELDQERRGTADKIIGRIAAGLPDLLTARSTAWQASLEELLDPCIEQAIHADAAASAQDRLKTAQRRLEETGRGIARGWLERRTGEVLELLTSIVADQISVLLEGARSPGLVGAEIAGLAGGDDRPGPGGWTADDVPSLAVRPPEWTVLVPLPRRFGRKPDGGDTELPHRLADALDTAISAFEASTRARFDDAAQDWARRLDEQAARQAREAAAYFRRCLRTTPSDEDLAALHDLVARFADLQASLAAWEASSDEDAAAQPAPAADTRAGAGRTGGCVVCEQMQATLSEHLRRDQFRLAAREHDQARHALAGGYCPLHTWQYAAIASPLGISAGYAKLAASVADALESIGRKGGTAGELASLVAALTPRAGTCPLCASLAERERSVITGITSGTPDEAGSAALCLRHLTLALTADPKPETGRAMVRALADALHRNADDMQAYALKREALHRGLLTEEESGAYLDALRRLAGLPAFSQP